MLDASNLQHKVRLSGIDAPERRQAYGERARQNLAANVHHKAVLVVWKKQDRYGRIVGRVLVGPCAHSGCSYTIDAGLEQIRAGLAWHYKQYAREQAVAERLRYAEAERQARSNRAGLWHDESPVPPWAFRRHAASGFSEHASASIERR
ncbi:MAG TPA: thermonuclease family protein [Burkholderiales bacterium]|nr:thermonuclease family protein [Burkholderiales bacterium]